MTKTHSIIMALMIIAWFAITFLLFHALQYEVIQILVTITTGAVIVVVVAALIQNLGPELMESFHLWKTHREEKKLKKKSVESSKPAVK